MECYVCGTEITADNETDEHIIINAAGGRLKSKELICIKCNSDFGADIDSALAKQINDVANLLMIKRHRGEPQPIIGNKQSTGEKYAIDAKGKPKLIKPKVDKTIQGNNVNISVTARNENELRQILNGLTKKVPHFDIDEAMKSAKWQEEYFEEPLQFQNQIGGKEVFRAICKCATNFFIYCKGDPSQIKHLITYIKGEEEKDVVWMHYRENLYDLNSDESLHIIQLVGNPSENILYCYIDYFNTYKYIVLLNDNYKGVEIKESYCFDLINVQPIQKDVQVNYDRATLLGFFSNKDAKPFEKVVNAFNHTVGLGMRRQGDNHQSELIKKGIQDSLGKYPDGTLITEQMLSETVDEIMKNVTPYLLRQLKRNKQ